MLQKETKYQSKVFRDFKMLDKRNYHSIVRFCEEHRRVIDALNFDEYFILELNYVNALFETEAYKKHIKVANTVIEQSIMHNIQYWQGEDIYLKTLYQKAQSHYYLQEYKPTLHIIKELIKLKPNDKEYLRLFKRCVALDGAVFLKNMRAVGVLLFLLAAGLFVINILIVENFYAAYSQAFSYISMAVVSLGGILLLWSVSIHRYKTYRQVKGFMKGVKSKK